MVQKTQGVIENYHYVDILVFNPSRRGIVPLRSINGLTRSFRWRIAKCKKNVMRKVNTIKENFDILAKQ